MMEASPPPISDGEAANLRATKRAAKLRCVALRPDGSRCQRTASSGETCARHAPGYVAPKRAPRKAALVAVDPRPFAPVIAALEHAASAGMDVAASNREDAACADACAWCLDPGCSGSPCRHTTAPVEHVEAPVPKRVEAAAMLPGLDAAPRGRALPDVRVRQRELGQFFTPAWLAAEVASCARMRGAVVLEPSAGGGAIVAACLGAGAARVIAVEVDPLMASQLRVRFSAEIDAESVEVICADFLALPVERFDSVSAIVGNPPYDDGADGDHLARCADIISRHERLPDLPMIEATMLLRTVALHCGDRFDRVWSRVAVRELLPCADRIAFEIDGKIGAAGLIDVSIMRIGALLRGERGPVRHIREPRRVRP